MPREWLEDLECDKTSEPSFTEEDLKLGQRLVGEALWLAAKTRPDIMYVVNAMASHVARKPLQVTRMGKRLLAYLAGTVDLTLVLTSPREGEDKKITCFTALRMRASLLLEPGAMELRLSHMAELQSPGRRANRRLLLCQQWRLSCTRQLKDTVFWNRSRQVFRSWSRASSAEC